MDPNQNIILADAVVKGLENIGAKVSDMVASPDTPDIHLRALWGFHVARCWANHTRSKVIVFGPMIAWHFSDKWLFQPSPDNASTTPVRMVQGPELKKQRKR